MGPFFAARARASACPPGWCSGCGWRCCCASPSSASSARPAGWASARRSTALVAGGRVRAGAPDAHGARRDLRRGAADGAGPVGAGAAGRGCRARLAAPARPRCSGLAVFCVGGVNAVATLGGPAAAGAVAAHPARAGRAGAGWSAWWVAGRRRWPRPGGSVPLLLLGRYSPPFLDYIETAAVTTSPTDVLYACCGAPRTGSPPGRPSAGPDLAGRLVAGQRRAAGRRHRGARRRRAGRAGPAGPARAHLAGARACWPASALVTLGHLATVDGCLAGPLHDALDGALAPLRNVHKFDPVLRLPLVARAGAPGRRPRRRRGAGAPGRRPWRPDASARCAGVLVRRSRSRWWRPASPALAGRLAPPTGFEQFPRLLAARRRTSWPTSSRAGARCWCPASSFGTYAWGSHERRADAAAGELALGGPQRHPAHAARRTSACSTRSRSGWRAGEGSAGLARFLARAGISHLVLRNDLDAGDGGLHPLDAGPPGPARLARDHGGWPRSARRCPGSRRAAGPGPRRRARASRRRPSRSTRSPTPRRGPGPRRCPTRSPSTVARTRCSRWRTAVCSPTARPCSPGRRGGRATTMVSDALLRRERDFGRLGDATSAGLAPDDPLRLDGPARDYPSRAVARAESVVRLRRRLPSASSSASDPDSLGGTRPRRSPGRRSTGTLERRGDRQTGSGNPGRLVAADDGSSLSRSAATSPSAAADSVADAPAEIRLATDTGSITRTRRPRPPILRASPSPPGAPHPHRRVGPAARRRGRPGSGPRGGPAARSVRDPHRGHPGPLRFGRRVRLRRRAAGQRRLPGRPGRFPPVRGRTGRRRGGGPGTGPGLRVDRPATTSWSSPRCRARGTRSMRSSPTSARTGPRGGQQCRRRRSPGQPDGGP